MSVHEPFATAVLLTVAGLLLALSVVASRASGFGIPIVLVFLGVGMLAGSEGVGGIEFENYALAFRVGSIALALILFDGGLNTPRARLREVGAPSVTLATVGVLATAGLVGVGARLAGFTWAEALLLGAIVSSTDAAAVFSVLRGSALRLRQRVQTTLEAESGLNDPMAVVLTIALTSVVAGGRAGTGLVGSIVLQLAVGLALGWAVGHLGLWLLGRLRSVSGGLYAVLGVGIAFLAFGVPTLLDGSGFLAVYVAGVVLGNGSIPHRAGILRVHDALAWLSQVVMFLVLGLLVFPSRLVEVALPGTLIALFLTLVVRPLVTVVLLTPFRYPLREQLYIGFMGLRGAVPIILGTFPVLAGVGRGERIFDIVFFVVLASVLLQGPFAGVLARRLGVGRPGTPAPPAVMELSSTRPLRSELLSFTIAPDTAVAGVAIGDVPLPEGAGITLVMRDEELLPPTPAQRLEPGDHAYVFCRPDDAPGIHLLFGRPEAD